MSEPSRVPVGQDAPRWAAVERAVHRRSSHRRPIAAHSEPAIDRIRAGLERGPCVLDLGCGTGRAVAEAARTRPDVNFVGVDRSAARLVRAGALPANARVERADIDDVLAVAAREAWRFEEVWALYPNPWPKPGQLDRRLYARPAFGDLIRVARRLEVRTNWRVYADEFAHALVVAGTRARVIDHRANRGAPTTAFEIKYAASGHALWKIACEIPKPKPI